MATLNELKQSRQKITRRAKGAFYTDIYTTTDPGASSSVDVSDLPQLHADEGTEVQPAALAIAPFNDTTITPSGGGLVASEHIGDWLTINAGTGSIQQRKVISNTTTAYTISTGDTDWTTTPDATSSFNVRELTLSSSVLTNLQVDRNWRPGEARVIAKYEPQRLYNFLRDRPGRAMLTASVKSEEMIPAKDEDGDEVWYEDIITEDGERKYVRWKVIKGKRTLIRGRAILKLTLAKFRGTEPTIATMKGMVGTINDANTNLIAGATTGTLLFLGSETVFVYDETIDLIELFFAFEPAGWNELVEVQREEAVCQDIIKTGSDGAALTSIKNITAWKDSGAGAGKNYKAKLYVPDDFSVFNGLVEWGDA